MAVGGVPLPEPSFRALVESSPDGIVIHEDGIVRYANAAVARMLGYDHPDELLGGDVLASVHDADRAQVVERMGRLLAGEPSVPFLGQRLIRRDGGVIDVSIRGVRLEVDGRPHVCAIVRDVSEQRQLEARLVAGDRMAALGTLSAGIAHEINNPLTYLLLQIESIAATTQRLRPLVDGDALALVERLAHHVAVAQDGAGRVRDIVRELKVFARSTDDSRRRIDCREAVRRALRMTQHELSRRADVTVELTAVPPVFASEGRLTQVFVNLLLNAADAIGEGDPKFHRIVVRAWAHDAEVHVSVSDTGPGIAPEHLPRVFEPFFTTKPVGEGTGLGLAIVHGIVTGLGGRVAVESSPAGGTTFTVTLPVDRS